MKEGEGFAMLKNTQCYSFPPFLPYRYIFTEHRAG